MLVLTVSKIDAHKEVIELFPAMLFFDLVLLYFSDSHSFY